jgi:hypothetical protein
MYVPVDTNDDSVKSEWCVVCPVLIPDLAALVVPFMRFLKCIVYARNDQDKP